MSRTHILPPWIMGGEKGFLLQKNIWIFGAKIATVGLGVLLIPVYTHLLPQAEYGKVALVSTLILVLGVFADMGVSSGLRIWFYRWRERGRNPGNVVGTVWTLKVAASVLACAVFYILRAPIMRAFLPGLPLVPVVALAIGAAVLRSWGSLGTQILQIEERPIRQALLEVGLAGAGYIAIILSLLFFSTDITGYTLGNAAGGLFMLIASLYVVLSRHKLRIERALMVPLLAFGLPLVIHSLAGWALSMIDRVIINSILGFEELAVYHLGYQVGNIMSLLALSANQAWNPVFYRNINRDRAMARRLTERFVEGAIVVLVASSLMLSSFSREIVILLAPPRYVDAGRIGVIVSSCYAVYALYYFLALPIFHEKKSWSILIISAGGSILNVIANLLMIPLWGIDGAALASLVSFAAMTGGAYLLGNRYLGARYDPVRISGSLIVLAVGTAVLYMAASHEVTVGGVAAKTAFAAAAGLSAYLIVRRDIIRHNEERRKGRDPADQDRGDQEKD